MRRTLLSCLAAAAAMVSTVHAQSVSISGSFTGAVTQGFGRCGPHLITLDATFSGFLSPFGAVTGTQSGCVTPGSFDVFDGLFNLSLVGGTLFGTQSGTFTPVGPQQFTGTSTFVITGGTGRFAGATGSATSTGTQNLATGTIESTVTGVVNAPGVVPEPATLVLTGAGLAALGLVRRRRGA